MKIVKRAHKVVEIVEAVVDVVVKKVKVGNSVGVDGLVDLIPQDWKVALAPEFNKTYFKKVKHSSYDFIEACHYYRTRTI